VTDFLILRRTGPAATDLQVCSVIQGKKGDEGEQAIKEGAQAGDGRYLAVSLGNVTERDVRTEPVLSEPTEDEAAPAPESVSAAALGEAPAAEG
jgi:hypothetical protein